MGCLENIKIFFKSRTVGAKSPPGQKAPAQGRASKQPPTQSPPAQKHDLENRGASNEASNGGSLHSTRDTNSTPEAATLSPKFVSAVQDGLPHSSSAQGQASSQPPNQSSLALNQKYGLENPAINDGASNGGSPHSTPDTNLTPEAATLSLEPSNAAQETISQLYEKPPADSLGSLTSLPPSEQLAEGSQHQEKQKGPPLVIKTLWEKAAADLKPEGLKKLNTLFKSKRPDQTAVAGVSPTPDDVREIVSKAKELKKDDSNATWRPVVNKIMDGALKFKALGDAAVKFDKSGYAVLGWSVVSFGLQVVVNAKKARNFVIKSSEIITQFMTRYAQYEALFRIPETEEEFDGHIVKVYSEILLYVIALNDYLKRCNLAHLAGAVYDLEDSTVWEKKKDLYDADTVVQSWLSIIEERRNQKRLKEIKDMIERCINPVYYLSDRMQRIQKFRDKQDNYKVLDRLPDTTIESSAQIEIRNTISDKVKDPGKWLTELADFKDWQNSKVSSGIWLRGNPGTGKTVLTSTVVEHLTTLYRETADGAFAYCFCSGTANAKRTSSDILGSILRQLASTDAGLELFINWQEGKHKKEEEKQSELTNEEIVMDQEGGQEQDQLAAGTGTNWQVGHQRHELTNKEIQSLISHMIKLNSNGQTTIIIDAMDEIDEDSFLEVMKVLKNLLNGDTGLLKVFLSSRPEGYINVALRAWPSIDVTLERTQLDIYAYIDTQVDEELVLGDEVDDLVLTDLKIHVKKELKVRAAGMFRYVVMAVTWICRGYDEPWQVELAVKQIPGDLVGIYEGLCQRISNEKHTYKKVLAMRAIAWVLGAKTQLHSTEFIKAISAGYMEYKGKVTIKKVIQSCHYLMTYNEAKDLIEFGHFTVVEFFAQHKGEEYGQPSVHSTIAFLCLIAMRDSAKVNHEHLESKAIRDYVQSLVGTTELLDNDSLGITTHERRSSLTFWAYATNMWAFHCEKGGADSGATNCWDVILSEWCDIQRESGQIPLAEYPNLPLGVDPVGHRVPESLAKDFNSWIFMVSCAFGLVTLLRKLPKNPLDLAQMRYGTVNGIHLAARWGHAGAVKLLHDSGASVDSKDSASWTPLAYAIRGHHVQVVTYLVSHQANPNTKSSAGISLLSLAKNLNFKDGSAILVKHHATLEGTDENGKSSSEVQSGTTIQSLNLADLLTTTQQQMSTIPHQIYEAVAIPFQECKTDHYSKMFGSESRQISFDTLRNAPDVQFVRKRLAFDCTPDQVARMQGQTRVLGGINFKHIARIVSTYELVDDSITREFGLITLPVPDGSLKDYLNIMSENNSDPNKLRGLEGWMFCLASALAYLHEQHLRHGDIKPVNITYQGDTIFLTDFGVGNIYPTRRASAATIGRVYERYRVDYSPPEVMSGKARARAADIFSLGAIFSEMVTVISKRSLPQFEEFRGNTSSQSETLHTAREGRTTFASTLPEIGEWLSRREHASTKLITSMLSNDPEERPTAQEVVSQLRDINPFPTCDCMLAVCPP